MTNANLVDDYYSWLVSMVNGDDEFNCDDYTYILGKLFSERFYWTMDRDENRSMDGLDLRETFCNRTCLGLDEYYILMESMPEYCTILEMMVALAMRIEDDIMADPEYGDRTSKWFWTMMKNSRLADLDDASYEDEDANEVIFCLLNRQYLRDGFGGFFCTTNRSINMRNVEIWYQMNYYFDEFCKYGG